tara:strand:+ start:534 stop:785 length:252 start_codon:yes stop_codon:yes gene_type:complete
MIIEAILQLNPKAVVTVRGNDIDTCEIEWHDKNPNNITKSDIKAKIAEMPTDEELVTQKQNDKTSAHNKLKALGLTNAEIEAL